MRLWKIVGLAGAVGLAATGVAVGRRRTWHSYDADELRERLHERLAEAERTAEPDQNDAVPVTAAYRRIDLGEKGSC